MHRLVVFDIDGTICDTNEVDDRCYVAAVSGFLGIRTEQVDWSKAPHITDSAILAWLCQTYLARDLSFSETDVIVRRFKELLEDEWTRHPSAFRAIPGAPEILDRLEEARWHVAFATGGWRPTAELKLRNLGIDANRYVVATASEAITREEIVTTAISSVEKRMNVQFDRVVSVGDGDWDVRTAAALGLPFVWESPTQRVRIDCTAPEPAA